MATELYNVLEKIIDPRYMSIFTFKKGQKIQFPGYCIKTIFWLNNNDKIMLMVNGVERSAYRDAVYYNFTIPWQGMAMNLTSSYIYRHNINAKNKINMYPFTYSELNVPKNDYFCELRMENNDDMFVVVQHSHHFPVNKIFI